MVRMLLDTVPAAGPLRLAVPPAATRRAGFATVTATSKTTAPDMIVDGGGTHLGVCHTACHLKVADPSLLPIEDGKARPAGQALVQPIGTAGLQIVQLLDSAIADLALRAPRPAR